MSESETVVALDVLAALGFEPIADPMPGLRFDFGNFELRASELINLSFQQVVQFSGVMATSRTLTDVQFHLPTRVTSREQCTAMIAYYLDKVASGRVFQPLRQVDWVAEGRHQTRLLPWVIEQAERELKEAPYRARPYCHVWREWARLALKTLAQNIERLSDETPVVFFFKDSVLTIRCNSEVIALAGTGKDWPTPYAIDAGQLRQFPTRFRDRQVEVSIWEGKLTIGNQRYSGIREESPGP